MGLIFLDSFDDRYFTTGASYSTYHAKWDVVFEDSSSGYANSLSQVTGRTGKACKLGGASYLQKTGLNISTLEYFTWGAAFKIESAPGNETTLVEIEVSSDEGTKTNLIYYNLTPTLYIKVYATDPFGNPELLGTSTSALNLNQFYYIESTTNYQFSLNDIYLDGTTWVTGGMVLPVSGTEPIISKIKFSGGVIIDDLYLTSANSNQKFNQPKIDAIVPNSNGTNDTNAWQSVSYLDVDECFQANHDANTTYDQSNTASPSRVSYNFSDISVNSIKGVQSLLWVAGFWNSIPPQNNVSMTAITYLSNTYYESNTKSVSSLASPSYVILLGLWENNPNTSSAWTSSTFNSAEFGVKALPSSNNLGRLTAITVEVAYDFTVTPPAASRIFIIS